MKSILSFIGGILGLAALLFIGMSLFFMVDIYPALYIKIGGWKYLVALIVIGIVIITIRRSLVDKAMKLSSAEQDELSRARAIDLKRMKEYDAAVKKAIDDNYTALSAEMEKSHTLIKDLEKQLSEYEEKVASNNVIHKDDKELRKIYRLIDFMEHGRADSVKEALLLDDKSVRDRQERARREAFEKEERLKAEKFREEQRESLDRIAEEQRRYNNDQKRYNEEKIRLEERRNEMLENEIRERKYNR